MNVNSTNGRLAGKTAVITGTGAGIGAASARLFAEAGARLVLVDIDAAANAAQAAELRAEGADVLDVQVDLTDESAVEDMFARARNFSPELHVMFNCAGGSTASDDTVDKLSTSTWTRTLELELLTVAHCSRFGVPWIRESGGGSVVNMSSFAAFRGTVGIHAYAAAKAAVSGLTRSMAGSYAKDRIRVNAIAPGVALSERAARRITETNVADKLTFAWADYPFAMAQPRDIASVALFLASDESFMLTGQTLMADGGLTVY